MGASAQSGHTEPEDTSIQGPNLYVCRVAVLVLVVRSMGGPPFQSPPSRPPTFHGLMWLGAAGVLPDHGGSVQLTLGACSFLLRHHPDTLIRQQVCVCAYLLQDSACYKFF